MDRRNWCISMAAWPQIAAALQEARAAAGRPKARWRALDAASARELETLASLIIPPEGGPGAREAGVIYFIDQWVATFGADELPRIQAGLAETERKRQELFPESASMAELAPAQQIDLMRAIEHTDFFDLLRTLTVLGFLGDPSHGGNRDRVGWNQIGFEPQMSYQHPFGYYDSEIK
jgi:gluconate 2-dehydrogenase gamma chain